MASVGNGQLKYPTAYNFVLGVSATNTTNRLASFSNWCVYVGVTAPGTSLSAPFVSEVALMLRTIKPLASKQEII